MSAQGVQLLFYMVHLTECPACWEWYHACDDPARPGGARPCDVGLVRIGDMDLLERYVLSQVVSMERRATTVDIGTTRRSVP